MIPVENTWAGYFAVLIAPVRHDKRLSCFDKLVFSELAAVADIYLKSDIDVERIANYYDATGEEVADALYRLMECGCITRPEKVDGHYVTELLKY